jgi:hypothetical protein
MPAITLRLTDEQHATLVREAAANSRSVQREIVHRCFRSTSEALIEEGRKPILVAAEADHFKPDFGSKLSK